MGKKYLESKEGSLEQSILGLWEKAADKKEDADKDEPGTQGDNKEWQAARAKVLKGFGVKSCAALPTEEEKKACFKALDDAHVADHEESVDYAELHNEINTFKIKNSKESWEDAINQVNEWSKVKKEQDNEEEPKKKGKTATGKKPDAIDMNPDVEEGKKK